MIAEKMGYIPSLDGIRGTAIILVLLTHANFQLGHNGIIGVHMFFTLSGFLITTIILQEKKETSNFEFSKFYKRRFLRLFPALLLLIAIVSLYSIFFTEGKERSSIGQEIFGAIFYFYNVMWVWGFGNDSNLLAHTWSLAVEEQFYLVWPVLLAFGFSIWSNRIVIITFVFLLIFSIVAKELNLVSFLYSAIFHESIFFGCIAALIRFFLPRVDIPSYISTILFLLILLVGILPISISQLNLNSVFYGIVGLSTSIIILSCLNNKDSKLVKFLSMPGLVFIGKISYSLYLWHVPIFKWFKQYSTLEPWQSFVFKFVVTIFLSILTWFFVENKYRRSNVIKLKSVM
jgi:peptidoglycan/LPS O-acetylase OafA/YrhL